LSAGVARNLKGVDPTFPRDALVTFTGVSGSGKARIDGEVKRLEEDIKLHRYKYHTVELVLDRLQ